jgi:glycosyltransferase involved in cell wall biosynthesis
MPDVRFVFAGYGEAQERIEEVSNAQYVGFKTGQELEMLIRKAKISVYPSEWYENCPFSVIESQMYGTPVIGSRMGGIPELIAEGQTGELFHAKNADELEEKIRKLMFTPGLADQYAQACLQRQFETPESYYEKLMTIYGE